MSERDRLRADPLTLPGEPIVTEPELSGRQQLELSLLCIDYDAALDALDTGPSLRTDEGWEDHLRSSARAEVPLLRYVHDERITRHHFDAHQMRELNAAYTAALMIQGAARGYPRDSLAARALSAAGLPFVVDDSDDDAVIV